METNVWSQLFAQVAGFLSSLLGQSSGAQGPESSTASTSAQGGAVPLTSTLKSSQTDGQGKLTIARDQTKATTDALFGAMDYDGQWLAVTMERTAVAIPAGTYQGYKRQSEHFGRTVLGIDVPNRTNIECHPANWPCQLDGCVAVGEKQDGDALDNSESAFDRMMAAVSDEFTVQIS